MKSNNTFQSVLPEATVRYLKENEYAFSLPRRSYNSSYVSRQLRKSSISNILSERIKQSTFVSIRYLISAAKGIYELRALSALKSSKVGKNAMVLGNGPSLGYLTSDKLSRFKKIGGEIFSVNFWSSTHLSDIAPNHLVISDGVTLANPNSEFGNLLSDEYKKQNLVLASFLHTNENVKILCPLGRVNELGRQFGVHRITGFVDHEMRALTSNIDPRFPRGYLSMTLFKTLALAIFFGYDKIFLIGMDNTFPRDTYCDNENKVCRLERHAGGNDYLFDQSIVYPNMAIVAQDFMDLFSDLHRCFSGYAVINLDPFSLTDTFLKVDSLSEIDSVLGLA
jgi:hypothetical protein